MKRKKAGALVEFILIAPFLIFFLLYTFQIFQMNDARVDMIKTSRYMAWEKTDDRNDDDIMNEVREIYNLERWTDSTGQPVSLSFDDLDSMSGLASAGLELSMEGLDLNTDGLMRATALCRYESIYYQVFNSLLVDPTVSFDQFIDIQEQSYLLTDTWATLSNDPQEEVRDHLSGYWLLGPASFSSEIMGFINDIINISIDMPWPFDDVTLCAEQPPRVNLDSVPERF